MLFYMIAPLLFFAAMNRVRLMLSTAVLLAVSIATLYVGDCRGALDCQVSNNSFSYFWPPVQGPCFIVGMWAWYGFRSHLLGTSNISMRAKWLYFALAVTFAIATAALGVWLAKSHAFAPILAACAAAAFLLFVCSQSDVVRRWAQSRVALSIRQFAAALGRESYGIYLWHFICVYATFHFFAETFRESDKDMSVALYVVTVMIALTAAYGLSRLSDRLIQGRATRLSRKLLKHVDGCFHASR